MPAVFDFFDYYDFLGVSPTATAAEIKAAYRQKALKWHPDKQKDASTVRAAVENMKTLNAAKVILLNPVEKAAYDKQYREYHEKRLLGSSRPFPNPAKSPPPARAQNNGGGGGAAHQPSARENIQASRGGAVPSARVAPSHQGAFYDKHDSGEFDSWEPGGPNYENFCREFGYPPGENNDLEGCCSTM